MYFDYNRLKGERIAKGLTVEEMAEEIGVTKGTYSKKENGKIPIVIEEFALITKKLDIKKENISIFFTLNVSEMATN